MAVHKLELIRKARAALSGSLGKCELCPRRCRVDRASGALGYCRAGAQASVYSYMRHRGEEPPISGTGGSGTIFFSHCSMKCAYCQNYNFSQLDKGEAADERRLAAMMTGLQASGCHNINLVSPTHYLPQILSALERAVTDGLAVPIVYNTSGYELQHIIKLLDGIVDIYLPDMRYSDDAMAVKYSDASGYVELNRSAVSEMRAQAGTLLVDEKGVAVKGLLIRLLALPEDISGTRRTLKFIRDNIGPDTYLSIMSQYYPAYRAGEFRELSRGLTPEEFDIVVDEARVLGFNKGWTQESPKDFDPKFLGTNIQPRR
jgi:putative pyruvate formate lyase activating enzyme